MDQRHESVLVPIYGTLVPFHILTVKNATNNQDGDHSYIRINFNFGPGFEPGIRFPNSMFIKELSFRSADIRHAAKVTVSVLHPRRSLFTASASKVYPNTSRLKIADPLQTASGHINRLSQVWGSKPSACTCCPCLIILKSRGGVCCKWWSWG